MSYVKQVLLESVDTNTFLDDATKAKARAKVWTGPAVLSCHDKNNIHRKSWYRDPGLIAFLLGGGGENDPTFVSVLSNNSSFQYCHITRSCRL